MHCSILAAFFKKKSKCWDPISSSKSIGLSISKENRLEVVHKCVIYNGNS